MSAKAKIMPTTITVTVPMKFERRGGRKAIVSPVSYTPQPARHDNALIKALARAHRWRRMIETGQYPSITELAKAEKVNQSYACRILRLTLLAPDIVTAILDGRQHPDLTINDLMGPFAVSWKDQSAMVIPIEAAACG